MVGQSDRISSVRAGSVSFVGHDRSVEWFATCDKTRALLAENGAFTAASNVGCFLFPSLDAALLEITGLLADREREVSGARNTIAIAAGLDPSLELVGKSMSALTLTVQMRPREDWSNDVAWVAKDKNSLLFALLALDDRFSGEIHHWSKAEEAILAAGMRVPLITISFLLPRNPVRGQVSSFSIETYELANGCALVLLGERLRLQPRLAPFTMTSGELTACVDAVKLKIAETKAFAENEPTARKQIEAFEANLPAPFRARWEKGARRVVDRAIFYSKEIEGSWLVEELTTRLKLEHGEIETMSACRMGDERRQEWLRNRGQSSVEDAWQVRGTIHLASSAIGRLGADAIQKALAGASQAHEKAATI